MAWIGHRIDEFEKAIATRVAIPNEKDNKESYAGNN